MTASDIKCVGVELILVCGGESLRTTTKLADFFLIGGVHGDSGGGNGRSNFVCFVKKEESEASADMSKQPRIFNIKLAVRVTPRPWQSADVSP